MAFTISDSKDLAESWPNVGTILGDNALLWTNEFIQNEIDNRAWAEDTEAYATTVNGTWYALPTDFMRLISIADDDDLLISSDGYTIRNRKITFLNDDTYTMTYIPLPAKVTSFTAAVSLPDIYMYPLAYFLAYKHLIGKPEADRYGQLYSANLKSIANEMDIDSAGDGFQIESRW